MKCERESGDDEGWRATCDCFEGSTGSGGVLNRAGTALDSPTPATTRPVPRLLLITSPDFITDSRTLSLARLSP